MTDQIEITAGRYINKGTKRIVVVTKVEETSVRFHDEGDDYMHVESMMYFRNDFDKIV